MKKNLLLKRFTLLVVSLLLWSNIMAQLPAPETFFGFNPGDDREMFTYEQLMDYMHLLDEQSPMIHIEPYGITEMGKPMFIIFISSEQNIANLDRLKKINRQLALNEIPEGVKQDDLVEEGKMFFLSTLSMHATEVGPAQALPLTTYELLTGSDARRETILKNTVAMFIPHNPDGMNMIVDYYNKHKGTSLETSSMPGVYHKYVGHNINRDLVTLSQRENKMISSVVSSEWFPQAMIERHQMGSNGPRFFISPPHDPIAENVDAGVWNWMRVFGSRAIHEMTDAGMPGVSVNYLFDDYWPGATTTSIWKGVIGMLSEAASVNIASPIYVEPNEIRPGGKGLSENSISINLPTPWEGGWWRLSDILRYEKENTLSNLYTGAIYKNEILHYRNEVSQKEILRGKQQAPFYYILPHQQADVSEWVNLINLLHEHGIAIYSLTKDMELQDRMFKEGDVVIPMSQPYRAFIKEVLEVQKFPERFYTPGGEMIKPYDITSWSLPLHRGVNVAEINISSVLLQENIEPLEMPFSAKTDSVQDDAWALFSSAGNESFKAAFLGLDKGIAVERTQQEIYLSGKLFPAGSFLIPLNDEYETIDDELGVSPLFVAQKPDVETKALQMPRVGIVETWFHDMDAGWLRFIFDQYHIPYKVLRPADLQEAKLQRDYDILYFGDRSKSVYLNGKFESNGQMIPSRYPAEYAKGMEKKGLENLLQFIDKGGKVMAWGPSVELFLGTLSIGEDEEKQEFILPVRNVGKDLSSKDLYVPGSLLRVKMHNTHPLAWGMSDELGVFHRGSPVFRTSIPYMGMDRRVIASFADEKILMSGFAENEELLRREAALVWIKKGEGQLILSSFNPQFRASTPVTYKLIFNALWLD